MLFMQKREALFDRLVELAYAVEMFLGAVVYMCCSHGVTPAWTTYRVRRAVAVPCMMHAAGRSCGCTLVTFLGRLGWWWRQRRPLDLQECLDRLPRERPEVGLKIGLAVRQIRRVVGNEAGRCQIGRAADRVQHVRRQREVQHLLDRDDPQDVVRVGVRARAGSSTARSGRAGSSRARAASRRLR